MNNVIFLEFWKDAIINIDTLLKDKNIDELTDEQTVELFHNIPLNNLIEINMSSVNEKINEFHKNSLEDMYYNLEVFEKTWGKGFAYYAFFIDTYIQFSDSIMILINEFATCTEEDKYSLGTLRYINGRAIQVANGILASLRNGYPDDGYARVRTLYEILITTSIIVKYGNQMAKNYIEYNGSSYNWVKPFINPKRGGYILFSDLEENCSLESNLIAEWKKEQKKMHKLVHASPQGTFDRFGGYMKKEIPVGSTDTGMDLVATNTIRIMNTIFHQYTSAFIDESDIMTTNLMMSYLKTLGGIAEKMEIEFKNLKQIHFNLSTEDITNEQQT